MKFYNKITFALLSAMAVISCERQNDGFENKLFIDAENFKNEVRVATDEGVAELVKPIKVAMAQPMAQDVNVTLRRADELFDTYRQAYYHDDAELLPAEYCNLDDIKSVVKAGDIASDDINIAFKNLDKLDYSKQYVLPVTIEADGIAVLERAKTMYFVIKEASLVNYVAEMYENRAWPIWDNWEKVSYLEQFTMECLINCHNFNNSSSILTVMGVEDHFLIRIGDVTIPTNQIQVALAYKDVEGGSTNRADVTDASLQLRKDRWYHLAVTFNKGYVQVYLDGRLKVEADRSVIGKRPNPETGESEDIIFENVNFAAPHSDESDGKPRCFWVGYSYDSNRSLDGMIAEARLWNRVLTKEEINAPNHFYKLYDNQIDESLLAYWKFNEGAGKAVKDYSIYGKDLEADHTLIWYPVELP
ncbi:MAG: DUF1735 and LamG domain-containing protein [Bacteroidales bacterium]|nr:DUF1735 and LamG domain-containing protein [Bacteroidales bacterium]